MRRSSARIRAVFLGIVTLCLAAALEARAAEPPEARDLSPVAQVSATGTAELRVPPARASFSIGVITDAGTSAQAGADNARTYQAVEQALQRVGLTRSEIVGSQFTVSPRWVYDEASRRQRRAGFEAVHSMQIETARLDRLGLYIDAATGAGASSVSDVAFAADNPAAARHQALTQAVQNARGDAEAMARAAGGSLGALLQLGTEQPGVVPGVSFEQVSVTASRRRDAVATTVTPTEIEVTARVVARWAFVPAHH